MQNVLSVAGELLNAKVAHVSDVNESQGVDGQRKDMSEFAGLKALEFPATPGFFASAKGANPVY